MTFFDLFHCLKPNYATKSQSKITPEHLKDDTFASTTSRTTITACIDKIEDIMSLMSVVSVEFGVIGFFFLTFLRPLKLYNFL